MRCGTSLGLNVPPPPVWDQNPLTNGVVPSVDSKQATAGDGNHSRYCEMGQSVGSNVGYGGIGRKL